MSTSVLALDLATTTGWAWHSVGMPRPFFDAFRLPGGPEEIGQPAAALETWLRGFAERVRRGNHPLTHIVFEAQHIADKINKRTAYRLIGLGAVTEKLAFELSKEWDSEIHCYDVHIGEWRKHFIGRGGGFKKTPDKKSYLPGHDPKELAIRRCAEYGWHTDSADAAEACGILDYMLSMLGDDVHPRPWRDAMLMKSRQA